MRIKHTNVAEGERKELSDETKVHRLAAVHGEDLTH